MAKGQQKFQQGESANSKQPKAKPGNEPISLSTNQSALGPIDIQRLGRKSASLLLDGGRSQGGGVHAEFEAGVARVGCRPSGFATR